MVGSGETRRTILRRLAAGAVATVPLPALAAGRTVARDREVPFSSPLSEEDRPGRYRCRGCARPLFDARAKYPTSTGWPTFSAPLRGAVRTSAVAAGVATIDCAGCGAHLGDRLALHGSAPSHRYSIDGLALTFSA